MRLSNPKGRPARQPCRACICITTAGRTRRLDSECQGLCMTLIRTPNPCFLSPQSSIPVRSAHLHYALGRKNRKQQPPTTKAALTKYFKKKGLQKHQKYLVEFFANRQVMNEYLKRLKIKELEEKIAFLEAKISEIISKGS